MDLKTREEQLRALAEQARVEWERQLKELPNDPRVRVAGLATLLGIDAIEALNSDRPTRTLGAEARKRKAASEKYAREQRELLRSLDVDLGEEI
jgi:hypothetical protein